MSNAPWRARREAYLRDFGRTADLVREGFAVAGFGVIEGGGRRVPLPKLPLKLFLPIAYTRSTLPIRSRSLQCWPIRDLRSRGNNPPVR
jgi:hypothetical protein